MANEGTARVALVTGASGGIGSEIVRRLAADGFAVALGYSRSSGPADDLARSLTASGRQAAAFRADVSKAAEVDGLFEAVSRTFGRIDVVVNNAGTIIPCPIADITEERYEQVFGVNVRGALFVLRGAARAVADNGRIVSTSSTMVGAPIAGAALYAGSKAALELFGEVLSKEVGPRGITVNTIRAGATVPGMFSKAPPERQAAIAASSPFRRLGAPKDIADVVAFLVSDAGRWVTGQTITVDGGAT